MKTEINRKLIESLSESNNSEFVENINDIVYSLMSRVVESISTKSPFVVPEKCVLIPVGENYIGSITQLSEFIYFLGIENPQIELNSRSSKHLWKLFLREFKASWRLGKKKYKDSKKKNTTVPDTIDKYKLTDFRHDVVNYLANFLTSTSIIYEYRQSITIKGRDDFGTNVRIRIYICSYDSHTNTYKMLNESKNKYINVNLGSRYVNLNSKVEECGDIFVKMISLLNAIYSKNFNRVPNQILVESLVYNCPKQLFDENDVYKTFVNIVNYIRLSNPKNIVSVCDSNKSIFEEFLIVGNNSQLEFNRIISMLDNFKY